MIGGAISFYRNVVASEKITEDETGVYKSYEELSRAQFLFGTALSVLALAVKTLKTALYIVDSVVDVEKRGEHRKALLNNAKEIPTYLFAVEVGLLGILFPETTNNDVLDLSERVKVLDYSDHPVQQQPSYHPCCCCCG
jgi:hypothetical protein